MDAIWSSYYLFFLFCFLERKVGSHENVGRPCSEGLFSWECICSPITSLQVPAYVMTRSEVKSLSRAWLFVTPWTVAYQVPLAMGCSRQEYWSGLPSPSPGDLPDPGIEPESPMLQVNSLLSKPSGKPLNYWDSLLNNFYVASFVIFRFIPHCWLPFPFLKPFSCSPPSPQDNIIVLKASIVTFPMTASSTPSLPFPCRLAEATYTPTAYSCPYAVLFFPPKAFAYAFFKIYFKKLFSS